MKLGFIGLGNMGCGMASNLLKKGFDIRVFDIDRSKVVALEKLGAISSSSVKEFTTSVDTVILCLPHPQISAEVIFGKDGLVNVPNSQVKTIIETSTLTPEQVIDFENRLKKLKIGFLSAPMFGGQTSADTGKIWFVVEGDKKLLPKYKNLLLVMGRKISYLGEMPQATIAKLARNMCRFANVATALEVIDFLRKTTKDIKPIYDLLVEDSKTNFDKVWERAVREYALEKLPYRASKISVKDLKISLELAKEEGIEMPVTEATIEVHQRHTE